MTDTKNTSAAPAGIDLDKLEALARAAAQHGDDIGEDEWYSADENMSLFVGNPDLALVAACSPVAVLALISLARRAAEAAPAADVRAILIKLCDQLESMRRTMFLRPGTGQNYSYLVHEDVAAYVEQARAALAQQSATSRASEQSGNSGEFATSAAPVVAADDVIASALAVVQDAIDGRRSEVHPCDWDNDDLAVRQCSPEIQTLHAALKAACTSPAGISQFANGEDAGQPAQAVDAPVPMCDTCDEPAMPLPGGEFGPCRACLEFAGEVAPEAAPEAAHADDPRLAALDAAGRQLEESKKSRLERAERLGISAHAQQAATPRLCVACHAEGKCMGKTRMCGARSETAAVSPSDATGKADAANAGGLKDHEIRETVNKLRDIALQYHAAGQLRAQIADFIVPILKSATSAADAKDAERLDLLLNISGFHFEIIGQKQHLLDARGRTAGIGTTKREAIDAAIAATQQGGAK